MTTNQVNYLNIGLMLGSLLAALALPFEIFLLSYAILGPLHYLTEMSWLHDRNYFMPEKWLAVPIALLTLTSLVTVVPAIDIAQLSTWNAESAFGALALALVFVVTKTANARWIASALVVAACIAAHYINLEVKLLYAGTAKVTAYDVLFMVLLTTIIHVFVFTGAFVLYGALRGRSRSGYLSVVVFLGCALACFLIPVQAVPQLSRYTHHAYEITSESLLAAMMYYGMDTVTDHYRSPAGVMLARFIGFAYTYHYLNWFSKTSIIKWHAVPLVRMIAVVVIWIASVVLYGIEYELGLYWLLLLSMMHVFLEFPLNWQSFFGIGRELYARARPT